jgi:hypothetical protein
VISPSETRGIEEEEEEEEEEEKKEKEEEKQDLHIFKVLKQVHLQIRSIDL